MLDCASTSPDGSRIHHWPKNTMPHSRALKARMTNIAFRWRRGGTIVSGLAMLVELKNRS
ncbi:hypothetical protein SAMN03159496_05991 [Rhizobium sp. NFR07]|nr:hypothetical protein SAMN03159496_05991 [Rhizobium sp. NFR07]